MECVIYNNLMDLMKHDIFQISKYKKLSPSPIDLCSDRLDPFLALQEVMIS